MSSADGNSKTGPVVIVGYLAIFAVINFTLIQGMFNMIFLLPDQILSMAGGSNIGADLGKDTENRVYGLYGRFGGNFHSIRGGLDKAKSDRAGKELAGKTGGTQPGAGDKK